MQVWKEAGVKDEETCVELLLGLNKLLCHHSASIWHVISCSSFDVNVAAPIAVYFLYVVMQSAFWSTEMPL